MFQAVIIRLLCQMNVSASLQTAAVEPPSIMSYSPQPLVRANKILLTNFYLAFVRRLSHLATPNCSAHSYKYDEPIQNYEQGAASIAETVDCGELGSVRYSCQQDCEISQ